MEERVYSVITRSAWCDYEILIWPKMFAKSLRNVWKTPVSQLIVYCK